jgi:hypothetical protein
MPGDSACSGLREGSGMETQAAGFARVLLLSRAGRDGYSGRSSWQITFLP